MLELDPETLFPVVVGFFAANDEGEPPAAVMVDPAALTMLQVGKLIASQTSSTACCQQPCFTHHTLFPPRGTPPEARHAE